MGTMTGETDTGHGPVDDAPAPDRMRGPTQSVTDLELGVLAQRVVEAVTAVTDFAVATLTVRDGRTCRRIAAAGIEDARLGSCTDYDRWSELLLEEHRRGSACFLIPPEASDTDWSQTVPIPAAAAPVDGRSVWTADHGLVVELVDGAGDRIGFLSVDAPRSGLLPDASALQRLELFARQVQSALQNARLHDEIVRQRDTAEALRAVAAAVSSTLDLDEVLRSCCEAVVAHSIGDRASIYLHDPATGRFHTVMSWGGAPDRELWAAFRGLSPTTVEEAPVLAEAMRTGAPVLIPKATDAHVAHELLELFSVKSLALYPLRSGTDLAGLLVVDTHTQHVTFSDDEVDLVAQIADQAAVAIRQAELHQHAKAQAARADELYELTKQMTRTFDFDTVFARIVEAVTVRTSAYAVGLMEVADGQLSLLRTNVADVDPDLLPYRHVTMDDLPDTLWPQLSRDGAIRVDDLAASPLASLARPRARSLLIAGHRDIEDVSLVLHMSSDQPAAFSGDDADFARGLVEVAALALRNARLYDDVRRSAEIDSLTGLRNRRTYGSDVAALLAESTDANPLTLLLVDVDDFKAVNDQHGHATGDRALMHVADRIRRSVREVDRVYRLGGEEFAVLMSGTTAAEAQIVGDRIREGVTVSRSPLPRVTVSVGAAVAPRQGTRADDLFRAADAALYAAKDAGKDTVRLA